ncbi:MAG TPA: hemerythrin domain-containing protein [Azospirillum sp.]|nr:hemerythrin domain-containing protein [Azospirillum sp.]
MLHMTSRIGRMLHDDHLATLRALEDLDALLERQGDTPPDLTAGPARDALAAMTGIVRDEVGRHFGFEEEHLFPALRAAGQAGMTQLLISEHRAILPAAEAAGALAAQALAAGAFDPTAWQAFAEHAREFVEREMFHIQKEEMGLLAAIAALIGPDDDARLAETFKALT